VTTGTTIRKLVLLLALWQVATGAQVFAQAMGPNAPSADDAKRNAKPSILDQVGIDQKLGAQVPLDLKFRDEFGKEVALGSFFQSKRPVLLALVYYDCPMLCNQVLNGMASALSVLKFNAGNEFDILAVSFDPRDTPKSAAAKKEVYLKRYRRIGADQGSHFLTGQPAAIAALTKTVGFRYAWDDHTKQFAHSSALILLTPQGKVAQYYYGIEYSPKDMRLGMIEASNEKIGTLADQIILYCFHYDPTTGKYGAVIMAFIRLGGILTVLAVGMFVVISLRRENRDGGDRHDPLNLGRATR
jgi:protein SCO1/2